MQELTKTENGENNAESKTQTFKQPDPAETDPRHYQIEIAFQMFQLRLSRSSAQNLSGLRILPRPAGGHDQS